MRRPSEELGRDNSSREPRADIPPARNTAYSTMACSTTSRSTGNSESKREWTQQLRTVREFEYFSLTRSRRRRTAGTVNDQYKEERLDPLCVTYQVNHATRHSSHCSNSPFLCGPSPRTNLQSTVSAGREHRRMRRCPISIPHPIVGEDGVFADRQIC